MTAQDYIFNKLKEIKGSEPLAIDFKSEIELVDFIFKSIMNKKFRKYSVTPDYQEHIKSAIKINVEKNEPIKFCLPFGGYKLWRLDESPEVDWAELFAFMYYANWLKPVTKNYKPGVLLDFSSDDIIIERMNNIPKKDTDSYVNSFKNLIIFLEHYLSSNTKITITPVGSRYGDEEFNTELKERMEEIRRNYSNELPKLDEKQKKMIELNVKLKPGQDNDPFWKEKVELIHDGYAKLSKRRPYFRTNDKILFFTTPIDNCVAVGTTKTSVVKFWVGAGALKRINDCFIEYVLSPSQIAANNFNWEDVLLEGLKGRNFKKIRIFV